LNGAKRLNPSIKLRAGFWNAWNGLIPVMNGASGGTFETAGTGFLFALDRLFQRQKATAKPFKNAYIANLH
jgi:hypothetical protein